MNKFLIENGALVKVTDAGRAYGMIAQQSTAGYNENPNNPNLPSLLMGNEDYGRIYRTATIDHIPVVLRINIHNEFYPTGRTVYNVVGELPGTDKADEVVMNGGHFDSWNPATGATDNAAGGAVAVEALRLIHTLNLPHRRTLRVALWSGEEEGLYGSIAYVAQHFGSAENPKPEWFKLDAYLNLDDGTGKPRAASVFGPPEAAAMVQTAMDNFKDWGFYHVNPTARPPDRRHRQHLVQQRWAAGCGLQPGSVRLQHLHAPHQLRHLRADLRAGHARSGGGRGADPLRPRQRRPDGAALLGCHHASASGRPGRRGPRPAATCR